MCECPVAHKTFEVHDIDWFTPDLGSGTSLLASVVAYAAANGREGVVFFDGAVSIGKAFLTDERDVAHGALFNRTGVATGSFTTFFDGEGIRDGLRISLVDSLACGEQGIELIGADDGTGCCTVTATRTFGCVHKAGMSTKVDSKIPWFA